MAIFTILLAPPTPSARGTGAAPVKFISSGSVILCPEDKMRFQFRLPVHKPLAFDGPEEAKFSG